MPITIAQPEPLSTAISSRYGAAEQSYRDIPQILEARRMQLQAQQAAQASAQAGQQHDAALAQQGAEYRMGLQQSAYDSNSNRTLAAAQYQAQLQQAPALAQQHAELSAWVNQQDMTQADNLRLQKLQSALSEVMGNPNLMPQEKSDYAMQLKTGIDPLDAKMKRTQMKKEQMQTDNMQKEQAHKDGLWDAQQKFFGSTNRNSSTYTADGRVVTVIPTPDGKFHVDVHDAKKDKEAKPFDVTSALKESELEAEGRHPDDIVDPKTGKVIGASSKKIEDRNMYKWDAYNRIKNEHETAHGAGKNAPAAPGAPADQQPPAAGGVDVFAPPPAAAAPPREQLPYKKGEPVTPEQIAGEKKLDAVIAEIDTKGLPAEEKKYLKDNIEAAKHWLSVYGSPDKMPEQIQQSFQGVMAIIKNAPVSGKKYSESLLNDNATR